MSKSSGKSMEAESVETLKRKVAELEVQLREALQAVKDKGTELDVQVELLTATREQLERKSAETERVRTEVDDLQSKVNSLERERDELKSRVESGTGSRESGLLETFEKFIEAQTKVMSTHAKTVTVQNFPPLPSFTGEEIDCEDKSFVKWHERFEERAKLAGWDDEQKTPSA